MCTTPSLSPTQRKRWSEEMSNRLLTWPKLPLTTKVDVDRSDDASNTSNLPFSILTTIDEPEHTTLSAHFFP